MQQLMIKEFNAKPKIKRLAEQETPTYRAISVGINALSLSELISIIIGDAPNCMEIADYLVDKFKTPHGLKQARLDELQAFGLGEKRAMRIIAAFSLGERYYRQTWEEKCAVHSPTDVANLVLYEMSSLDHEELWVVLLDTRNNVVSIDKLYKGSVNQSQVRVSEIFRSAVIKNSPSIIIIHNHPSGDPTPSPDDVGLTRAIVQSGKMLDIDVLDHLVIGQGRWASLKERGLGFS